MTKVLKFHEEGYNCAESIVKVMNEENGLNIPVSIASPFGTGMAVCSVCGAVTGALMVLGAKKGRNSSDEFNESRRVAKEIMNKVKERYGTYKCLELKKKGIPCSEIIQYTYDILKEYV